MSDDFNRTISEDIYQVISAPIQKNDAPIPWSYLPKKYFFWSVTSDEYRVTRMCCGWRVRSSYSILTF